MSVCTDGHVCIACYVDSLGPVAAPLLAQLDALQDELTILALASTPVAVRSRNRVYTRRHIRTRAFAAWPAIEQRLMRGPASSYEIGLLAYGPANKIVSEQRRAELTDAMLHRMARAGVITRLRRGVFALPGGDSTPTTLDALRVLISKRALTVPEIAAQLDISVNTAYRWIKRLRDTGVPLDSTLIPGATRPMQRWHIVTATESAATTKVAA